MTPRVGNYSWCDNIRWIIDHFMLQSSQLSVCVSVLTLNRCYRHFPVTLDRISSKSKNIMGIGSRKTHKVSACPRGDERCQEEITKFGRFIAGCLPLFINNSMATMCLCQYPKRAIERQLEYIASRMLILLVFLPRVIRLLYHRLEWVDMPAGTHPLYAVQQVIAGAVVAVDERLYLWRAVPALPLQRIPCLSLFESYRERTPACF